MPYLRHISVAVCAVFVLSAGVVGFNAVYTPVSYSDMYDPGYSRIINMTYICAMSDQEAPCVVKDFIIRLKQCETVQNAFYFSPLIPSGVQKQMP